MLQELQRKIEDLNNRGPRHNIRIRGLPEDVQPDKLEAVIFLIFNDLLEWSPDSIELERFHRVLHPRGEAGALPWDVLYCVVSFPIKEEILRRARDREHITYGGGGTVELYQNLSPITLQQRRALRPLFDVLRSRGIPYSWRFPFGLSAAASGQSALLHTPTDLIAFYSTVHIPSVALPDWSSPLMTRASDKWGESWIYHVPDAVPPGSTERQRLECLQVPRARWNAWVPAERMACE